MGRATQGVRMIAVKGDAVVSDVAKIPASEDEEGDDLPATDDGEEGTADGAAVSSSAGKPGAESIAAAQQLADELIDESSEEDAEVDDADGDESDDDA